MYQILLLPLIAGAVAQIIKIFITDRSRQIRSTVLISYSGMPSGHSAMVISLATILGLKSGWNSPVFALSVVFAVIIIRDALGLRQYLGEHGKILNILVKDLKDDDVLDEHYPHLIEKIGHTPPQVIAGAILGILVSLIGYLMLK